MLCFCCSSSPGLESQHGEYGVATRGIEVNRGPAESGKRNRVENGTKKVKMLEARAGVRLEVRAAVRTLEARAGNRLEVRAEMR